MASIRDRLIRLENRRRFLDWFVWHRLCATLTLEELETYASGGGFPNPIPNRPSSLDTLDRKSLLKLWEEDELRFGGRSQEELDFFAEHCFWPEQRGRLHYSMQDGRLFVDWRNAPEEEGIGLETTNQSKERDHQIQVGGTNDIAKEE
jgi:hypothetical protein